MQVLYCQIATSVLRFVSDHVMPSVFWVPLIMWINSLSQGQLSMRYTHPISMSCIAITKSLWLSAKMPVWGQPFSDGITLWQTTFPQPPSVPKLCVQLSISVFLTHNQTLTANTCRYIHITVLGHLQQSAAPLWGLFNADAIQHDIAS